MAIQTQSADGVTHEFPDGTPPEAVDKAMKSYAEEHRDKSTTLGEIGHGIMDPIEGGGQLISNILPKPVTDVIDKTNNYIADKTGLLRKLPEGGKNQQMAEREAAIQKERGGTQNTDWARMAGQALSPVNYIGAELGGGAIAPLASKLSPGLATAAKTAASGVTGGVVSGAEQPVQDTEHFAKQKLKEMGLGGLIGGTFGGASGVVAGGLTGLGSYVARNYPENLTSEAVAKVLKRIKQDQKSGGPSATDALDLVEAAQKQGPWGQAPGAKPLALVDVGGENTKGLGGNVARAPGESRAVASVFLKDRDEEAAKRLSADIQQHISGGPSVFQATEGLLESRSVASSPLYKEAHALQNVWSPRLDEFLSDPALKTGMSRGYEIERLQSLARGEPLTATQMGVDIGVDGSTKILGKPNVRILDMAKQGLDAMIADERNEITGRLSARGVALDQMRQAYVKAIDEADKTGIYRKARETWAGYSASLDALKQGRTVFGASPEENAAAVAKMSQGDLEFYRMGVADLLKERLSKGGFTGDESKQLVKNPWMRDQLRPAFKDKADFDAFIDAVTAERKMFDTKVGTIGNSPSAGRIAEDVSETGNMGKLAQFGAQLASGHPIKAISGMWKAYQDLGLKPNPELNEKVAQILFSTKIPEDAIKQLRSEIRRKASNPMEGPAGEVSGAGVSMGTGAATAAGDLSGDRQAAP